MHRVLQLTIILFTAFTAFTVGISQTNPSREAFGSYLGTVPQGSYLSINSTSPISVKGDTILIVYGAPTGSFSYDSGVTWEELGYWSGNQANNSVLYTDVSPIIFGRYDYSFSEFGWEELTIFSPYQIPNINNVTPNPIYNVDINGNEYINVIHGDYESHFLTHLPVNAAWEASDFDWPEAETILNLDSLWADNVGNIDINDNGVGYYVVFAGLYPGPGVPFDRTLYIKRTEDYGNTWTNWNYVPYDTLTGYFSDVFPDSVYNDSTALWETLPDDWFPHGFQLEVIVDQGGNLHIFSGVIPMDIHGWEGWDWSEESGIYHFRLDNTAFPVVAGEVLPTSINFIGSLQDTWGDNDIFEYPIRSQNYSAAADVELAGFLYVVYHNVSDTNSSSHYLDLFSSYSMDGGLSWSTPVNFTNTDERILDESDAHIFHRGRNGTVSLIYQIPDWEVADNNKYNHPHDIYYWEYTFDIPAEILNHAPELQSISDQAIFEDEVLSLLIPVTDADDDILIYSGSTDQEEFTLSFNDGSLSITPSPDWSGSGNIIIEVSDDFVTVTDTFNLTVTSVNDPPNPFSLLFPDDDFTVEHPDSIFLSFQWNLTDDVDSDSLIYHIRYWTTTWDSTIWHIELDQIRINLERFQRTTPINWEVWCSDLTDSTVSSEQRSFTVASTVGVQGWVELPTDYLLNQNFPNPFNPSTSLRYGIPEDNSVSLIIYDIRGNMIRTLEAGNQVAGWYEYEWNGLNDDGQPVSTGLYLTRLQAGSFSKTIKMLYLK